MKRLLTSMFLTLVVIFAGGFTSCDTASCTASGLQIGEQVQISYRNSSGQTVDLVGYADANGEIHVDGCTEILAQFQ